MYALLLSAPNRENLAVFLDAPAVGPFPSAAVRTPGGGFFSPYSGLCRNFLQKMVGVG